MPKFPRACAQPIPPCPLQLALFLTELFFHARNLALILGFDLRDFGIALDAHFGLGARAKFALALVGDARRFQLRVNHHRHGHIAVDVPGEITLERGERPGREGPARKLGILRILRRLRGERPAIYRSITRCAPFNARAAGRHRHKARDGRLIRSRQSAVAKAHRGNAEQVRLIDQLLALNQNRLGVLLFPSLQRPLDGTLPAQSIGEHPAARRAGETALPARPQQCSPVPAVPGTQRSSGQLEV